MKKENRLKKRKEFNFIFSHGESISSKNIVLVFLKSKLKKYKVGFSVSKKVGKAVVRNKVRRRIKEIVRQSCESLKNGFNYIFIAKPCASEASFEQLKLDIAFLMNKFNQI